jgi:hypothetical protein
MVTSRTSRSISAPILVALAGGLGAGAATASRAGAAQGKPPEASVAEARAVAPLADQAAASALRNLVPGLVRLVKSGSGAPAALTTKLADPSLLLWQKAYGPAPEPVFVGDAGLTAAGQVAMKWLAEAPLHTIAGLDQARTALAERAAGRDPAPAMAPIDVSDEVLAEAWAKSHGAQDRLQSASQTLVDRVAAQDKATALREGWLEREGAKAAELDVDMARALGQMAAELLHQPRQRPVLENEHGWYLSPDIQWQGIALAPTEDLAAGLLAAARKGGEALDTWMRDLEPAHPQYRHLIQAARRYEELCAGPAWPQVAVPKLKKKDAPWEDGPAIQTLQTRLQLEGFYQGPVDGVFDEDVVGAVQSFQELRHLKPTEKLNEQTVEELNLPCSRRRQVLGLNIKRWRYTALNDQKTYVQVNLAGFQAVYFRNGTQRSERRVVVGEGAWHWDKAQDKRRYRNSTAMLIDTIDTLIVNPSWRVPKRIIENELQPKIDRNPNWLAENGYIEEIGPNGERYITQLPGPKNALGDVKLSFPNSESIYMHDTASKGYFNYPRRSFSHGCVRVHEALEFATLVLEDDYVARGEVYPGGIKTIAQGNTTTYFKLHQPVPVMFEYYTATVRDDGAIIFHPDIYDYDEATLNGPLGNDRKKKRPWRG